MISDFPETVDKPLFYNIMDEISLLVIVWVKDGTIIKVNKFCEQITGFRCDEIIYKKLNFIEINNFTNVDQCYDSLKQVPEKIESTLKCKDEKQLTVMWNNNLIYDESIKKSVIISIGLDVTDRKNSEEKMRKIAFYDSLTKLLNKKMCIKRLNDLLLKEKNIAVLFLDLDNFKKINDMYGHIVGDKLLIKIANKIVNSLNSKDVISRFGGDEFVILLSDNINRKQVINQIKKLLSDVFQTSYEIENNLLYVSASIGIAFYPDDGNDPEELLRNADKAMYKAKKTGKNNYCLYSSRVYDNYFKMDNNNIENKIINAIKEKDFLVFYQPQIDLKTGNITGVEALLRWHYKKAEKLLYPKDFINCIDKKNVGINIDKWVIAKVCKDIKKLEENGFFLNNISINLCCLDFNIDYFINYVNQVVKYNGIENNVLEFELSEEIFEKSFIKTVSKVRALSKAGYKISVDNYGKGCTSLNCLKELPLDKIKIDKSYIKDLSDTSIGKVFTKSIIEVADQLSFYSVAEGVETISQANYLKNIGCNIAQGYLFYRPVSFEELLCILKEEHKTIRELW